MKEGLIIKLYRERSGMTQTQLGKGICSVTHISKIESGNTKYSAEITDLICEKLNIDLEKEFADYEQLEKLLDDWLQMMIHQENDELDQIKEEIENNTFIHIPQVQQTYRILLARYWLTKRDLERGRNLLEQIQTRYENLERQNRNLLSHTLGIYYLSIGKTKKAAQHLMDVNPLEYANYEFYYHLASALHAMGAKVKAYHYCNLALTYFQKTNNFKRIIDTHLLMLLQMDSDPIYLRDDVLNNYQDLIKSCRRYNEEAKEIYIWHNLGVHYTSRGLYLEAIEAYQKVLKQCVKLSLPHLKLGALRGYVHSSLLSEIYIKEELEDHLRTGIHMAERMSNHTYLHAFHALQLQLDKKEKAEYFRFLEETFLPHLQVEGNHTILSLYERELFQYYREKGEYEKACRLTERYMGMEVKPLDNF